MQCNLRTPFSYPKEIRLRKSWEFDTVFRTKGRLRGQLVRLLYVQAPDGKTRWGLAVGKRLAKANGRVHGRRLLREAIRRLHPWVRQGLWIVAFLSETGLTAPAPLVYQDLRRLLLSRGLLTDVPAEPLWNP